MKVVLLAGGLGTRLREETEYRPKPMVEVGGRPILWHIMKLFAHHGLDRVRRLHRLPGRDDQGLLPQLRGPDERLHGPPRRARSESSTTAPTVESDWEVTVVDTGADTHDRRPGQAGRARTSRDERFIVTYGDGLADVDIDDAARVPRGARQARHVTTVRPLVALRRRRSRPTTAPSSGSARSHRPTTTSTPASSSSSRRVLDYLDDDCVLEQRAARGACAGDGQLVAYRHDGLLAADGHLPRVHDAERAVGVRARRRGRCGRDRR